MPAGKERGGACQHGIVLPREQDRVGFVLQEMGGGGLSVPKGYAVEEKMPAIAAKIRKIPQTPKTTKTPQPQQKSIPTKPKTTKLSRLGTCQGWAQV